MNELLNVKILLTGGGTAGSVTPLLAIVDELEGKNFEFLWLGTRQGMERAIVEKENILFKTVAAVKLHRFVSLYTLGYTLLAPIIFLAGLIQSVIIVIKFHPDWIVTAGSFVSVPVVWAGRILGKKILVHQQDARAGLANRLMAPFASVITVTFKKSLKDYEQKTRWVGNQVRSKKLKIKSKKFFNLDSGLPLIFIFGGSGGARFINELIADSLPELTEFCQIIHVTGAGKQSKDTPVSVKNYYTYEFLDVEKMAEAYQRSDIVISRCGLGTLSELSFFGKPAVLIPMPDTHQVDNAVIFQEESAAVVLEQSILEKNFFIKKIKELLADKAKQKLFANNIKKIIKTDAAKVMAKIIA